MDGFCRVTPTGNGGNLSASAAHGMRRDPVLHQQLAHLEQGYDKGVYFLTRVVERQRGT